MGTASRAVVTSTMTVLCALSTSCSTSAGTANTSTASVTSTSTATTESAPAGPPTLGATKGALEPGTYRVTSLPEPVEITVPAGWSLDEGSWLFQPGKQGFVGLWTVAGIYADSCAGTGAADVSTAADVVQRLDAQEGTAATVTPLSPTAGGMAVTRLELSATADLATCDGDRIRLWLDPNYGAAWISGVGETWTVYVLDVNGKPGIISAGGGPIDDQTRTQLDAMVASLVLA